MLFLRDRFSHFACGVAVFAVILGVVMTSWSTVPAPCTFGVTRYIGVDSRVFAGEGEQVDAKVVGGVRQAIRTVQITLGLPLVELEEDFGPGDGQWWAVRGEERVVLDTTERSIASKHATLIVAPTSNVTRLLLHNADPCDRASHQSLEPSITTDNSRFSIKHRDWRESTLQQASHTSYRATTVRIESRRQLKLRSLERAQDLFPVLRHARGAGEALSRQRSGYVHEAVFVARDGFLGRLTVVCSGPGDPIKDPSLVESIVVSVDAPPRRHDRAVDASMKRTMHHIQELLGRASKPATGAKFEALLAFLAR